MRIPDARFMGGAGKKGGEKGFKWPNAKSQKRENEFKGIKREQNFHESRRQKESWNSGSFPSPQWQKDETSH